MAKRHERTYARRQAVQMLYQMEILDVSPRRLLSDPSNFVDGSKPPAYAVELIQGTVEEIDWIDELLDRYAENWTLERMPAVDRAILRLACYEMALVDEVPISVAINEAVELAKDFGGEDESHRFVNGLLGRIAAHLDEEKARRESLLDLREAVSQVERDLGSGASDSEGR